MQHYRLPEPVAALLRGEEVRPGRVRCVCGREHEVGMRRLVNRPGALEELPAVLERLGAGAAWVIADEHTDRAAGERVRSILGRAGIRLTASVLPGDPPPHPNEQALGRLALDIPGRDAAVVAVGSGTITDLARFVASRLEVPLVAVPTAASVDGFTSSVAAMIAGGVRVTYPAAPPAAVVADPEIYAHAPPRLTASGWAELSGKWTALADWALAQALNGEYRCPVAVQMVEEAAAPVRAAWERKEPGGGGSWHAPERVQALMRGLLQVGVAMLMVGNSRPASGAEHHLAHFWEMRDLLEGREPALHGERVGVGTLMVQRLYRALLETGPAAWPSPALPSREQHEERVARYFGRLAGPLLAEQRSWADGPWRLFGRDPEEVARRRAHVVSRWDDAVAAVRPFLAPPEALEAFLRSAGAPASWEELGLASGVVADSLRAAREVRSRYTVLHLAGELGVL